MQNIYKGKILAREEETVCVQIAKDIKVTAILLKLGSAKSFIQPKLQVGDAVVVFASANAGLLAIPFLPTIEEEDEGRVFCNTVEFGEKDEKANIVVGGENIFEKLLEGLNAIKSALEEVNSGMQKIAKATDEAGAGWGLPPISPNMASATFNNITNSVKGLKEAIKNLNKLTL